MGLQQDREPADGRRMPTALAETTAAPCAVDAPPARGGSQRALVALFAATSFLSAFLLFLVQPMVAKLVLPPYGGAPSVWNTTNAFFQAALLAGYAYSHVLTARVPRRRQAPVHLALLLLPLVSLPLALPSWAAPPSDRPPALWLVLVLAVAVGAPFLAVSTTGPLLQRWFSFTDHERAHDPYFLYAAGNVGSFLALLAYPVVLEPAWSVHDQARIWATGYGGLVLLIGAAGWVARRHATAAPRLVAVAPASDAGAPEPAPTWRRRGGWLLLAAVPSSLMLGVTTFITADLAAVPLLWVLPLAAYLGTFVVAFGRPDRPITAATPLLAAAVVATAVLTATDADTPVVLGIAANLALFTVAAYVAHRRLALGRPGPEHLTGFYLVVALGGVLGGAWNAFVAPLVFQRVIEYPLAIVAAAVIGLSGGDSAARRRYGRMGIAVEVGAGFAVAFAGAELLRGQATATFTVAVVALAAAAAWTGRRWLPGLGIGAGLLALVQVLAPLPDDPVLEQRTFFGVYRVDQVDGRFEFIHGSTSHGAQDPTDPGEPLSYYTRRGPVGQVMEVYGRGADELGFVGLGVGALAAYGQAGQQLTFYEIDSAVVSIARDSGWFTYLTDTPADVAYAVGDGRLQIAEAAEGPFDVLVLDAFSGDAIPVHLLTVEAFELYRTRMADGGVIAVHISNRYLDLRPVLAGAAERLGFAGLVRRDAAEADGQGGSWWAVLAEDADDLAELAGDGRWHPIDEAGVEEWTDDRSDLLAVLGTG